MSKSIVFKFYLILLVAINTILLSFHIFNKKEGDEIMLAISLGDVDKLEYMIKSNQNINYSNPETPIVLAMKLGNPEIINLLINNKANLTLGDHANLTAIDYLFKENEVEVIKNVIPNVDRKIYEAKLSKHIISGLESLDRKNHRKIKNILQDSNDKRLGRVAKYIVTELASQENIRAAIFGVCSGTKIKYRKQLSYEALEYLLPYLDNKIPKIISTCKNTKQTY